MKTSHTFHQLLVWCTVIGTIIGAFLWIVFLTGHPEELQSIQKVVVVLAPCFGWVVPAMVWFVKKEYRSRKKISQTVIDILLREPLVLIATVTAVVISMIGLYLQWVPIHLCEVITRNDFKIIVKHFGGASLQPYKQKKIDNLRSSSYRVAWSDSIIVCLIDSVREDITVFDTAFSPFTGIALAHGIEVLELDISHVKRIKLDSTGLVETVAMKKQMPIVGTKQERKTRRFKPAAPIKEIQATLLVAEDLTYSKVVIDGKPATITERFLSHIRIRIPQKDENYHIVLSGARTCMMDISITENATVAVVCENVRN